MIAKYCISLHHKLFINLLKTDAYRNTLTLKTLKVSSKWKA